MAVQVNIAQAKAKLSSLLDQAFASEEVVMHVPASRSHGSLRSTA